MATVKCHQCGKTIQHFFLTFSTQGQEILCVSCKDGEAPLPTNIYFTKEDELRAHALGVSLAA